MLMEAAPAAAACLGCTAKHGVVGARPAVVATHAVLAAKLYVCVLGGVATGNSKFYVAAQSVSAAGN